MSYKINIFCKKCGKEFETYRCLLKYGKKYCSKSCSASCTRNSFGHKFAQKTKDKMSASAYLRFSNKTKHPKWIKDRTKLKGHGSAERRCSAYGFWRSQVYKRDNWACRISNQDCSGRIEAHHILGWIDYPELRYVVNNGITLCKQHHPRKRKEEIVMSPYFQELISNQTLS